MSTDRVSVYFSVAADLESAQYENISIIGAHSNAENLWLNETTTLNENWLSSNNDPATGKQSQAATDIKGIASNGDIDAIITNSDGHLDFQHTTQWCSDLVIYFLQQLAAHPDSKKQSLQMAAIQQEGSAISAQTSQETSIGDSQGKAMGSEVQGDSQAGTTASNAADSFTGVETSWASSQSSISA